PEFIQTPPSLIATASICAAVRGLNSPSASIVMSSVCALTRVDPAAAEAVVHHIERVVESTASLQSLPPSHKITNTTTSSGKLVSVADETGQPETPTDIQDIHF
ncbi:hypothetical protein L9F63_000778, partial [Diploptera punctata]